MYHSIPLRYSSTTQYLQVFVFQIIEVLEKLKQVFVDSKNPSKEKLVLFFSAFVIAKKKKVFEVISSWSGRLQIVFTEQIALTEDGYNALFCVYKPACRAGCHLGNFYLLFH